MCEARIAFHWDSLMRGSGAVGIHGNVLFPMEVLEECEFGSWTSPDGLRALHSISFVNIILLSLGYLVGQQKLFSKVPVGQRKY